MPDRLNYIIEQAIQDGLFDVAKALFEDGLALANGSWKKINPFIDELIRCAKNNEELETMEFIATELFPQVKTYQDGMIQDEVEEWEKSIADYMQKVERECDQYTYTRGNAWRKTVPDGTEYGLNPCRYDSEEEYLAALQQEKYRWRQKYAAPYPQGLDPDAYETEEAYRQARREKHRAELAKDKTIYTYCGVILPFSETPYAFRTNDETIKIGDKVVVVIGREKQEMEGIVVSVGQYARAGVPYPLHRSKFIVRKVEPQP